MFTLDTVKRVLNVRSPRKVGRMVSVAPGSSSRRARHNPGLGCSAQTSIAPPGASLDLNSASMAGL